MKKTFKNLFSKDETNTNKIKTLYENVDTSTDIISEYLHDIKEDLLKLEMISRLLNDTYLESKILYYREKLQSLEDEYVLENPNSKTVLSIHGKDLNYKLQLSLLLDETHLLSKKYFYLKSLNSFFEQPINESNFDLKENELLENEVEINSCLNGNDLVDKKLQNKFIDVIWDFLKQEVKLSKNLDFYMKLSRKTQILIQEKFLAELLERIDRDSYIKEYIKKNDMEQLTFDYDIFSYMMLENQKMVSQETSIKESQLTASFGIENLNFNFDFLRKSQLTGLGKLDIFKKRGLSAVATDFAIARGIKFEEINSINKTSLSKRKGYYCTKSLAPKKKWDWFPNLWSINEQGTIIKEEEIGLLGFRPIISFSSIQDFCLNKNKDFDGVLTVEFGKYMQTAADIEIHNSLEQLFSSGNLEFINEGFHIMGGPCNTDILFDEDNYPNCCFREYILRNKRYVRVRVNKFPPDSSIYLSNCLKYKNGDFAWIEVQKIRWLVDEKKDIAISEKILSPIAPIYGGENWVDPSNKEMYSYIRTFFWKDIIQGEINVSGDEGVQKKIIY